MPALTEAEVTSMLLNPFYAINIAPALADPHEPLVSRREWIGANVNMITDMGAEAYLARLLDVLKGDYPKA